MIVECLYLRDLIVLLSHLGFHMQLPNEEVCGYEFINN